MEKHLVKNVLSLIFDMNKNRSLSHLMVSKIAVKGCRKRAYSVSEIILAQYGKSRRVEESRGSLLVRVSPSSGILWEGSPCVVHVTEERVCSSSHFPRVSRVPEFPILLPP